MLISGKLWAGGWGADPPVVILISGRKRTYLKDRKFVKDPESGLRNRCSLSHISIYLRYYYKCFYRGGPLGCRLEKRTENPNMFENISLAPIFFACSPRIRPISRYTEEHASNTPWDPVQEPPNVLRHRSSMLLSPFRYYLLSARASSFLTAVMRGYSGRRA